MKNCSKAPNDCKIFPIEIEAKVRLQKGYILQPLVVEQVIHASPEEVFKFITDIEHSPEHISGIEKVEAVKGSSGSVGFTWNETRIMYGKEDTIRLEITELEPNQFYKVNSEAHGAEYETILSVEPIETGTSLKMSFAGKPKTFMSKMMMFLFGWLAISSTKKFLAQDLADIKKAVEGQRN